MTYLEARGAAQMRLFSLLGPESRVDLDERNSISMCSPRHPQPARTGGGYVLLYRAGRRPAGRARLTGALAQFLAVPALL